jgi:hypothetical protein
MMDLEAAMNRQRYQLSDPAFETMWGGARGKYYQQGLQHQPVPLSEAEVAAKVEAERERCAKVLEDLAAKYEAEEKRCWNDGESAANALREGAAKIREGK